MKLTSGSIGWCRSPKVIFFEEGRIGEKSVNSVKRFHPDFLSFSIASRHSSFKLASDLVDPTRLSSSFFVHHFTKCKTNLRVNPTFAPSVRNRVRAPAAQVVNRGYLPLKPSARARNAIRRIRLLLIFVVCLVSTANNRT